MEMRLAFVAGVEYATITRKREVKALSNQRNKSVQYPHTKLSDTQSHRPFVEMILKKNKSNKSHGSATCHYQPH